MHAYRLELEERALDLATIRFGGCNPFRIGAGSLRDFDRLDHIIKGKLEERAQASCERTNTHSRR